MRSFTSYFPNYCSLTFIFKFYVKIWANKHRMGLKEEPFVKADSYLTPPPPITKKTAMQIGEENFWVNFNKFNLIILEEQNLHSRTELHADFVQENLVKVLILNY